MALSDIAAGIRVTAEQDERGVPTVDDTGTDLRSRLEPHADSLPCTAAATATVLDTYTTGTSVGGCAQEAGIAPITAAKALHRCGVSGISPLGPQAREILCDWLSGDLSRTDALALTRASEAEFALAAYVETHDAVPALVDAAEGGCHSERSASVAKRDALAETMSSVTDLQ